MAFVQVTAQAVLSRIASLSHEVGEAFLPALSLVEGPDTYTPVVMAGVSGNRTRLGTV